MRKRLSSKVLAVILTLAICATTVLGCLMTVSANASCYSFGVSEVNDDLTEATIDVTFTAPASLENGFLAGAFEINEVDADSVDCLTIKSVSGDGITVSIEGNYVVFDTSPTVKTAALKLVFGFSKGTATKGKNYKVQLSNVELAYNDKEYYNESAAGAIATISTECEHVISVVGEPLEVDTANNYSVYASSVCTICGETFGMQLVPTAEKLGGGDASAQGTIDLLEFGSYLKDMGSTSEWYDTKVIDNDETGSSWDDPIIIDSAEEFVYLAKAANNETAGKYYKVADGIAGFDLSKGDLDFNGTLAANLEKIENGGKNHTGSTPGFQGHFDGNGATVYGAWINGSSYAGLFPCASGTVTIKNLNVKLSYFKATQAAGGLIGYYAGAGTGTLTVENCSVTDCYIESTSTGKYGHGIGAIYGYGHNYGSDTNGPIYVTNCFINLDEQYFITADEASDFVAPEKEGIVHGGIGGYAVTNQGMVSNCIVLGVKPYSTYKSTGDNQHQHTNDPARFQNVYTDAATGVVEVGGKLQTRNFTGKIFQITEAEMTGSAAVVAMPNLDWGNTWVMDGKNTYPRLAKPGEEFDTIYWDGSSTKTAPTEGKGTKKEPFIISTVAELAYVAGQKPADYAITDGVYFKIADGIKNIVMQPYAYGNDIMALSSSAKTKAYFEDNAASMKQWFHYGWEQSTFCGNIDFNGATVYGIYQVSGDNAGLFSNIDAGAVFQNLAIKNSYMVSQHPDKNYQVGAIAAVTNGSGYAKMTNGIVWAKNVVVANNYMYDNVPSTGDNTRAGVLFGAASYEAIYIDNALVYGNDATYGDGAIMPICSGASNLIQESAAIPEGLEVVYNGTLTENGQDTGIKLHNNMVRNSIILGAKPYDLSQGTGSRFNDPKCYENVYTDADVANDKFSNGKALGATEGQIETVNVADVSGAAAQSAMPGLTWGTDWYCGAYGEMPSLAVFTTVGVNEHSTAAHKLYGSSVTYNNDGTFDFNLHFVPQYEGIEATLYVGTADTSEFYKLTATQSSYRSELGDTALMFTLPNISARLIDKVWLPTIVVEGGADLEWGLTQPVALADNAKGVLAGDYDSADKAVSAALINYGTAAKDALAITKNDYDAGTVDILEFGSYLKDMGSDSTFYDTKVADNGETGTSWDDPIIIDSAEEFVYIAKTGTNDTDGKYYKVADGIAGFDLSGGKVDPNKSLKDNLTAIKSSGKNHGGATPGFQGNFDGNGITVYGAWTNHEQIGGYAGLFSCAKGDVTIKNVNVKLASFTANTSAGGIVGYYMGEGNYTNNTTLTIENCSVTESHLETTGTGWSTGVGAIVGRVDCPASYVDTNDEDGDNNTAEKLYVNNKVFVKNCFVDLDEKYFISPAEDGVEATGERVCHGGVIGVAASNSASVSDCVVIGITPYATSENTQQNDVQHSGLESHFANVYTTDDVAITGVFLGGNLTNRNFTGKIFPLTKEQLTGIAAKDNMPTLDWNTTWTTTSGYPTFINKDYKAPASGYTITWDGTTATGIAEGSGKKDDPYIINTAAELAYVVSRPIANYADTDGKYFKVADGIASIVLQPESKAAEIMALGSAAETKAYFENGSGFHTWKICSWENTTFCGNIDFNGATVYGAYIKDASYNAALIGNIDGGAVVSNLTLKNSYLTSIGTETGEYQVGAIAAVSNGAPYGKKTAGIIWINGVTVANNYLYNKSTSHDRSGVMIGASSDVVYTDNCLVYGNDATYGDGVKMPLYGTIGNAVTDTNIPEGLVAKYAGSNENGNLHVAAVRNSIILGCTPYDLAQSTGSRFNDPSNSFENVYTDADLANDILYNSKKEPVLASTFKGLTQVTDLNTLKGAAAQTVVDTLNGAIGSTVWYTGFIGDYPGFKQAGSMPASFQTALDSIVFDTPDTLGDGVEYNSAGNMTFGVYQTALSLKANPYMSFAFAFYGDYKTNRENLKVRFTYTENGELKTSEEIAVPAYTGENIVNLNGWTNTAANGRFHTFKADCIPVEALAYGIKVEVSYNSGAWADFGTFGIEGLGIQFEALNKQTPGNYYATRVEATKALLFYAQMIQARYGNAQ